MTFTETVSQDLPYLHQEDDEKIKVGYSSELFKEVLGYEVPKCVLCKTKAKVGHLRRVLLYKSREGVQSRKCSVLDTNSPEFRLLTFCQCCTLSSC